MLKTSIFCLVLVFIAAAQQIFAADIPLEDPNHNETVLGYPTNRFSPLTICEKVYSVISFSKVKPSMAQQISSYRGMTLASSNSASENEVLQGILKEREIFWRSGTNLTDRNNWVGLNNGLYFTYRNWEKGHPNNNLRCLRLLPQGKWDSFNWDGQHFFICENRCAFNEPNILSASE